MQDLSQETSLRDLIGQFEDFEMSEEPMVRLLRFHQHLSKLEDHGQQLKKALGNSIKSSSLEEKLIAAQYIAFLVTFYSNDQLEEVELLRYVMLQVIQHNKLESQGARKFIGILLREQVLEIQMTQARTVIQQITPISDISQICVFLDVLVKHMEWKVKRKVLVRQKKTNQDQFIHKVIDLCTGVYGQREEILSGKVRIAAATFNYLKEINYFSQTDSHPLNRNRIIRMRQQLLNLTIQKQEVALDICKAITISLNLIGIQSEQGENGIQGKIYKFLHNNENCINEYEYLELLLTFINLQGVKESSTSEIRKILSKLLNAIILDFQTSTRISYRSKAMMSDIIVKIHSQFKCELTIQIMKMIKPFFKQTKIAFMMSLVVILSLQVPKQILKSNPQYARIYAPKRNQNVLLYENTLRRYCDPNFDFSQSITNPEIREQLMWDLLLLRITIEANYKALIQLKSIHLLIINLIKMILLDCLPDQCYQIIQKIIQRENFYTIRQLDVIPLIKIIQDVTPILSNQVHDMENPIQKFNTIYRNLFKVIILLSKNHNLNQTKQPTLFIKVIRINNILNGYAVTPQLMKSQKQLLSACIVPYFEKINKKELEQAVKELIGQIQRHKSVQTFLIFLEVMNRSRRYPILHSIYTELNAAIENVIKQVRIPPTVVQSYRILIFLLSKPNITFEVVKDAWDLVRKIDSYHYIDQFHFVLQLHKYSDNYIRDNHNQADQINYLVYQMERILSLLNYIDDKFDNTDFLVSLEELTRYKLAILDYSLIVVTRYTKANGVVCNQTAELDKYLHIALTRIRETSQLTTIFNIRPGLRLKWINCQFSILLLIGHLRKPKLCFSERPIPELIKDLNHKWELLRKICPQEYKATLKYYSRLMNCKLIELREELREEQRS